MELREREVDPPDAGQVTVETLFSGISSGTELLAYRGEIPPETVLDESIGALPGTFGYPFAYGYSCVGLAGDELVFAFHPHQDVFTAPADSLIRLPAVDPRTATLFPLVETALQVTLDAAPGYGDTVVVLGLGVLGTLTALLLERTGARTVCAEPVPWRRRIAASLGLRTVPPEELAEVIQRDTGGAGARTVVDATGNPDAPGAALALLAHEGTLLIASWLGTKDATLPLGRHFHRRRLTIRSTQVSTIPAALSAGWTVERRRREAAALLGELPLEPLATHTFPAERAADAFAALDRGEEGLMHAALSYGPRYT
ncbi:zinc-binding alcohol dehydrogenase [Actinoallomurus purpureus]|uniref:zinc-dependent alcohol dehydrogenase n=1 Tax=Actinoallomurus purpureus TaxID=478114 RepID=UPI0020936B8F|nr:zinc-binding alcohol dehydrogenase [Actinoallomurus purpureus]MCO6005506.1 zinc-binding alcohol dehydrogenase [Actinoallomurus purpureus]